MPDLLTIPAHRPIKPVYIRDLVVFGFCSGAQGMKPTGYEVDIRPLADGDGGGFVATVPDLPGCRSDGETPHEALTNAYDATVCWIEGAEELGRAVPQPRRAAA